MLTLLDKHEQPFNGKSGDTSEYIETKGRRCWKVSPAGIEEQCILMFFND